jgi:hypothetical protein
VTLGAEIQNTSDTAAVVDVTTTAECTSQGSVTVNQQQLSIPAETTALYQTAWLPPDAEGTCTMTITASIAGTVVDTETWTIAIEADDPSPTATATPTATETPTSTPTSTATPTATETSTATGTATTTPTDPEIEIQEFGVMIGTLIQQPESLEAGVTVVLGARIQNNADVAETVDVVTTYSCPAGETVTINQQQVTIPAEESILIRVNWTPPDADATCTLQITATTVRTPVDTDTESWEVLLTAGDGSSDASANRLTRH